MTDVRILLGIHQVVRLDKFNNYNYQILYKRSHFIVRLRITRIILIFKHFLLNVRIQSDQRRSSKISFNNFMEKIMVLILN